MMPGLSIKTRPDMREGLVLCLDSPPPSPWETWHSQLFDPATFSPRTPTSPRPEENTLDLFTDSNYLSPRAYESPGPHRHEVCSRWVASHVWEPAGTSAGGTACWLALPSPMQHVT